MVLTLLWAGRQMVFFHDPRHTLLVNPAAAVSQFLCDPGVAVLLMVVLKDFLNDRVDFKILFRFVIPMFDPVIIGGSRDAGYL